LVLDGHEIQEGTNSYSLVDPVAYDTSSICLKNILTLEVLRKPKWLFAFLGRLL
jgi:hypothetical protein